MVFAGLSGIDRAKSIFYYYFLFVVNNRLNDECLGLSLYGGQIGEGLWAKALSPYSLKN
jgi:hypothetical protein